MISPTGFWKSKADVWGNLNQVEVVIFASDLQRGGFKALSFFKLVCARHDDDKNKHFRLQHGMLKL